MLPYNFVTKKLTKWDKMKTKKLNVSLVPVTPDKTGTETGRPKYAIMHSGDCIGYIVADNYNCAKIAVAHFYGVKA